VAVSAIFAFITSWNEFLAALVVMNKDSAFTLPLILAAARQQSLRDLEANLRMQGDDPAVLPTLRVTVDRRAPAPPPVRPD